MKSKTITGHNHRPFIQSLFAVSLIATSFMHTAQAVQDVEVDDGKNYPGSMCVSYSGASVSVSSRAAIYNSKDSESNVICPVVMDKIGGGIRHVAVSTIDPGAGSIDCRAHSRYRTNGSWGGNWTPIKSSEDGDPDYIIFKDANLDGKNQSHYFIRCSIPKRVGPGKNFNLVAYRVIEKE